MSGPITNIKTASRILKTIYSQKNISTLTYAVHNWTANWNGDLWCDDISHHDWKKSIPLAECTHPECVCRYVLDT